MSLTGLQIFKYLPAAKKTEGTNCKKCGFPTCMAYALKLAKNQADITKCPYVPDELQSQFCEATKIQQHTINLSPTIITGGETVMFRHDKTFVNPTVIAIELDSEDKNFETNLKRIKEYEIERIGEKFSIKALWIEGKNSDIAIKKAMDCGFCVINNKNADYKIVKGVDYDDLSEKSLQEIANGNKKIILELDTQNKTASQLTEQLTYLRRAAIIKKYEPLTYPVMVRLNKNLTDYEICSTVSMMICRYANIIVLKHFDEALISTLFTLRQNIYTNPQKPLQVEAKVYEFNEPDRNAPILLTTNFALTYFAVAGELESLKFGTYLVVTPSDGMSVLTAWSADKFTTEIVAKSIKSYDLINKVNTRKIIIPGLLSHMKDELQEALPDWKILVGTIEACQIPEFLAQN